mgnify:CR=1 FL=1
MRLSELKTGQSATILNVLGHGGFRRRIMEMGFVRGKRVDVLQNAPLRDPIKYRIMDYEVSLRRSEAAMIVVITAEEVQQQLSVAGETLSAPDDADFEEAISTRSRTINVALIGNPNSGKTSLFNAISGGHEHVGNYSGVTVDAKRGEYRYGGYRFVITDLPGTYALSAYTPEELYVRRHLVNDTPDVVVNAVVASNLERNLYLTTELIDIDPKMVVALNMYDELEASGAVLDYEHLGAMLGVPMVPVVAKTGRGLETLLDTVIAVYENRDPRVRHIHINNGPVVEQALRPLYERLRSDRDELPKHFPPRYFAMKLLERDKEVEAQLADCPHFAEWIALRDRAVPQVEEELGEDVETALANQKYGFSAKETLNIMQRLYENHKVLTYPRTDSRYIGKDVVPTIKERLQACGTGPYRKLAGVLANKPIQANASFVDDKKVSDHHAIIPTEQFVQLDHMTNEEQTDLYFYLSNISFKE